jgi:DNA mismatch endonuclease (patch repair protein)
MQANRRVDTRPELLVRSALHARGLRFRKDLRIDLPGIRVRPDVVFTRARLCIFVDGCFWHRCPVHASDPRANGAYWASKLSRNVERDRRGDAALQAAGWTVLRVWEHEDPEAVVEETLRALDSPRASSGHTGRTDEQGSVTTINL